MGQEKERTPLGLGLHFAEITKKAATVLATWRGLVTRPNALATFAELGLRAKEMTRLALLTLGPFGGERRVRGTALVKPCAIELREIPAKDSPE